MLLQLIGLKKDLFQDVIIIKKIATKYHHEASTVDSLY